MNDFESNQQAQSVQDPSLGDILRRTKGLTSEQVMQALEYQRSNGVRFGAAVVALEIGRASCRERV